MVSLSSSSCRDDSLCDVASQQHRKNIAIMVLNVSLFWLWPFNYCNGHILSLSLTALMVARPGDLPETKWKLISFSVKFYFDFWIHNVETSLMFPRRKPASGVEQSCVGFELISAALYSTNNSQSMNGNAKNRNNNTEALLKTSTFNKRCQAQQQTEHQSQICYFDGERRNLSKEWT